ncbi:fasciclin domain-containing protein [Sphingobacterium alkalisoli]|uniref:Fasciclin domain-containing protein n=1 Tax=Sphingobacterium alkalisoli TaxID=1874115 RepID=A0A4U0H9C6_9SPHI|nr:fasciclin domain-containing protein [Sphingobacterium alkalisoli]TJY68495.1 fasciclin domain-containing protein [Sphingobacterium alkalisoli]GGH06087.1 hypothetical protein GCM10011418_02630 [Sphingobacterium alkalisoli]
MKNIFLILTAVITMLIGGCQKGWEDHYGTKETDEIVSPLNLLEYLKSQPQYSAFLAKLEEYGIDKELERDQTLTVWVVTNDKMAQLTEMDFDEDYVLKYHINSLVFDKTKLKSGLRLMTFNGKYLSVDISENGVHVGDGTITKGNQLCKNGVVHEIDQLLKPDISIYDYLEGLGDSHSTIRDTILAMNDTLFDMENSIPVGVDRTGRTLYDSVFIISNPIFERANIMSEFDKLTMFLPSNEVLEECFDNLGQLYGQFGKPFLPADTVIAYKWIKEAIFYNTLIDNYGSGDITSAFNQLWKPTVQEVDPDYMRMSNGRIYNITKMKIPNNVHIKMIKQLFHYYEYVPDALKDDLFTVSNYSTIVPTDRDCMCFPAIGVEGIYRTLVLRGEGDVNDGSPVSIDFTPLMLERASDGSIGYKIVEVPPGEYNLYMGFRHISHPYVNIYVDGKQIASKLNVEPSNPWHYDRSTNTSPAKYNGWGGLVGTVMIDGDEVRTFKIKVEFAGLGKGTAETVELYHWALIPTANNY